MRRATIHNLATYGAQVICASAIGVAVWRFRHLLGGNLVPDNLELNVVRAVWLIIFFVALTTGLLINFAYPAKLDRHLRRLSHILLLVLLLMVFIQITLVKTKEVGNEQSRVQLRLLIGFLVTEEGNQWRQSVNPDNQPLTEADYVKRLPENAIPTIYGLSFYIISLLYSAAYLSFVSVGAIAFTGITALGIRRTVGDLSAEDIKEPLMSDDENNAGSNEVPQRNVHTRQNAVNAAHKVRGPQPNLVRVVVASPSDVQDERNLLKQIVDEVNRGVAADRNVHIVLCRWETDAYPGFHPAGPQALIDPILRIDDCELLIGIFWKHFGTPTHTSQSGTEHEFSTAYRSWQQNGRPQIMVYFNQQPYTPKSKVEAEQWGKVLDFRARFPREGLWWPYNGKSDFESLVRNHLTQFIRRNFPVVT